jgi:hypothetical protein
MFLAELQRVPHGRRLEALALVRRSSPCARFAAIGRRPFRQPLGNHANRFDSMLHLAASRLFLAGQSTRPTQRFMLGSREMGETVAPSSNGPGAAPSSPRSQPPGEIERRELERLNNAIGALRNGLGSIKNLELLIKSIKVGQKDLFAAVSAVHADCAPLLAHAAALGQSLSEFGVDPCCASRVAGALSLSLADLEGMLASSVESGRLSTARRLELERDLARCARELSSTLPLVQLFERAFRPRPLELTPVELVHAGDAERSDEKRVAVSVSPLPTTPAPDAGASPLSLSVDLEAAKALVGLAVALVIDGGPEGWPCLAFELRPGGSPVTCVWLAPAGSARPGAGSPVAQVAAPRISAHSALCAEVAARSLGARFEWARDARRVCIYWPMS